MSNSATVRVMSPEEIAARGGGDTPFLRWPERATLFAEREMRLRQLAGGHSLGDYLRFMAELTHEQHQALQAMPAVALPDAAGVDRAARAGLPPLPATDWPRDPSWRAVAHRLAAALAERAPEAARSALRELAGADEVFLERQADLLLNGLATGLDLGAAPVVGAALQVYWTHLLLAVQGLHQGQGAPVGRIEDATVCPCCGSRPAASVTRTAGESLGQRYLHCSLCNLEWHMVRGQCPHCLGAKGLSYQSLDLAEGEGGEEASASRAASAKVQAETCEDCGHYLKIVHSDRDPFVDPVADDLASLTLDLLVAETGKERHGVNFMLLFGEPEPLLEDGSPPGSR
ncbi:formate dehydrogenase accessory protein FdhE [Hydrogenophaga sp. YM1]|uniref:formate dehydrogenase accessory protein FdhE n=1 Tax=Hydrogenophaga sp. YM1 TaxID=2806262 RepID=UPI00195B6CFE|nr:formate dehydrogenase accessory protein FdhE [Hydrogenophaga sp. YM1]QRR32832.1 formate dehydrogenase accessory protein FdhE [Hydrogenophaga sp. YM1]